MHFQIYMSTLKDAIRGEKLTKRILRRLYWGIDAKKVYKHICNMEKIVKICKKYKETPNTIDINIKKK